MKNNTLQKWLAILFLILLVNTAYIAAFSSATVFYMANVLLHLVLGIVLSLAVVFTILTWFWACNPGQAWWHKRDLVTDLCYWFFIPVITRYLRIGMLIVGAAVLFRITTADGLVAFYDNGHGPLADRKSVV